LARLPGRERGFFLGPVVDSHGGEGRVRRLREKRLAARGVGRRGSEERPEIADSWRSLLGAAL